MAETLLEVGTKAPDFSGIDQDGNSVSLADFKGKKLVLYFYPKDDTPGCTKEACNLRDNYDTLLSQGYQILGVSADSPQKHRKFIDKYDLPFSLLADQDKEVIQAFGVWGLKKFRGREYMGIIRSTFIINETGVIEEVISKVKTAAHAEQILQSN